MGGPAYIKEQKRSVPELDNFYQTDPFQFGSYFWTSSEQLYQGLKFENHDHIRRISEAKTVEDAWSLGHSQEYPLKSDFHEKKTMWMYIANYQKIHSSDKLKQILLSTENYPILFKDSSPFWNYWNQKILERIRRDLFNS